jgi:lysophospholipase L1-like esterase
MDVRGERILVFGDSLSHHGADDAPEIWDVNVGPNRTSSAPGDLLASMLLEAGAQAVRINANVGRSAKNFWTAPNRRQTHPASALLVSDQAFRPTKVIVMLGTNDADVGAMDVPSITQIRDTYRAMGAEVIAIGPPVFANPTMATNAAKVYTVLGQVFPTVIDARPLSSTSGRASDGVHFQPASAKALATQLASKVIEPPTLIASAKSALPGVAVTFVGVLALGLLAVWLSRRELGKSILGTPEERLLGHAAETARQFRQHLTAARW